MIPLVSSAIENPRGSINVDRTLVRVSSSVALNWQIQYPYDLANASLASGSLAVGAQVASPNKITVSQNLSMRVNLLGASFRTNNGHGNNADGVDSSNPGQGGGGPNGGTDLSGGIDDESNTPQANKNNLLVQLWWTKNSGGWTNLFSGYQNQLVAASTILNTTVQAGDTISFGGRGYCKGWLPFYTTGTSTPNVVILRNGDPLPSANTGFQYGRIKSFLGPYLSADRTQFSIGSRQFIIFMELGQSDPNNSQFNLQDLVTLVTFE